MPELILPIIAYPENKDEQKRNDMFLAMKAAVIKSYEQGTINKYQPQSEQEIKAIKDLCREVVGGALFFDDEDRDNLLNVESLATYTDRLVGKHTNRDINTASQVLITLMRTYNTPELSEHASLNKAYGFVDLMAGKNNKYLSSNKRDVEKLWKKYKLPL